MSSSPSLQDRLLRRAVPQLVADYQPPPRELCDGVWVLDRRLLHFGAVLLPSRTTLVRLADGSFVVVSPPPIDRVTVDAINAIGSVRYAVAPNSFHYVFAADFASHYRSAPLLVAPGLLARAPDLDATELEQQAPAAWTGALDYTVLGPVRGLSEVLLFHSPTGTLILTDLAFNMTRYPRRRDRLAWRASGIPAGFGPGRTSRSLLLRDRQLARRCLARALEWPIQRIVVAHGEVVDRDAAGRLRSAFSRYL